MPSLPSCPALFAAGKCFFAGDICFLGSRRIGASGLREVDAKFHLCFPELDDSTLSSLSPEFRLYCVTLSTGWVNHEKIHCPIAPEGSGGSGRSLNWQ